MRFVPLVLAAAATASLAAAPRFSRPPGTPVDTYDVVEITVNTAPATGNPFTAGTLSGELRREGGGTFRIAGFCDSPDGSVWRVRMMPVQPGVHRYRLRFQSGSETGEAEGSFEARPSRRKGLLRVDPQHPHHFLWEGTGEHYFWNGLTTYALLGWRDEATIRAIIDRAAKHKVNRLRVSLNGPRVPDASRWYEPVKPSADFRFLFGPWIPQNPGDVQNPGWDVTRYDTAFWQKLDRTVRYARDRDVIVSIIFFLDGADRGADPFGKARAFSEDERRYYAYAAARLAAYSNVTWDITNEWHLFRDAWWVERIGTYLKSVDPYNHLASCHGRGDYPWMLSHWSDFAMFQIWDENGGFREMLNRREAQAKTGRPTPQINEEYGYEDHYPVKWGGNRRPPARIAGNRRRLAWEITMAGCYQTTGEKANRGQGQSDAPTPGGWINGGFDDSMKMLEGYAHMVDFFRSFDWWKLDPAPSRAAGGVLVLAEPSRRYVIYAPGPASAAVRLDAGSYTSRWYNPRTGQWSDGPAIAASGSDPWQLPPLPGDGDWALLVTAR
jgi:hypothetical protein